MIRELNFIIGVVFFLGSTNSSGVKAIPYIDDGYVENRVEGNLTEEVPTADEIAEMWIQSNLNQTEKDSDRNKYEIFENGQPKIFRDSIRIGKHWMIKKYCVVSKYNKNCMEVGLNPTNENKFPLEIRIRTNSKKIKKRLQMLDEDNVQDDDEESYEDDIDEYEYEDDVNNDDHSGFQAVSQAYDNLSDEDRVFEDTDQAIRISSTNWKDRTKKLSFPREDLDGTYSNGTGDRLESENHGKNEKLKNNSFILDMDTKRVKREFGKEEEYDGDDLNIESDLPSTDDGPSSGEDGSSRGEDGPSRGEDGSSRVKDGPSSGEDGASRGEDGSSRGEDGSSRGEDGSSRGEDGSSRGEDGSSRGEDSPSRSSRHDSLDSVEKKKRKDPFLDSNPSHSFSGEPVKGSREDSPYLWINCRLPDYASNAEILCKKWASAISCNLFCAFGYKFEEGIKRQTSCSFKKGKWTKKFQQCQPFIDCTLQLKSAGTLSCSTHHLTEGTTCSVSCESSGRKKATKKRTYECQSEGRWSPSLPHCVESEGIDVLMPPTSSSRVHRPGDIKYPKKYPFSHSEERRD